MSDRGNEDNIHFTSHTPQHNDRHQLSYIDTVIGGSLLRSPLQSQESDQSSPSDSSASDSLGSHGTHPNDDVGMFELGMSLSEMPTNETVCNTDHDNDNGMQSRDDATTVSLDIARAHEHDIDERDSQEERSIPCTEPADTALWSLGSQFDIEVSPDNDNADGDNTIPFVPSTDRPTTPTGAWFFDSCSSNALDVIVPTARNGYFTDEQIPTRQDQTIDGVGLHESPNLNFGRRPFETSRTPATFYQEPSIVISDYTLPVRPGLPEHSRTGLVSSVTMVQSTYDISKKFNSRWMSRLDSTPKLLTYCAALSPQQLFNAGIRTLQDCYNGIFPSSFGQVFALMHVVFAFTRAPTHGDGSLDWQELFRDTYRWRYLIVDSAEVAIFDDVWRRAWCPQASTETIILENGFPNQILHTSSPSARNDWNERWTIESNDGLNDGLSVRGSQENIHDVLMRGTVIKRCSIFLDAFKYVRIKERNARYPVQPNCLDQAYLINSVITPLKECGAPTVVPQLISKTLEQLGDGMLHNLRELEVTLTASAEWSRIPHQLHSLYLDHIATKCNLAAKGQSPNWRNGYYIDDLSHVMTLLVQFVQRQEYVPLTLDLAQVFNGPPPRVPQGHVDTPLEPMVPDSSSRLATTSLPLIPPVGFGAPSDYNHPSIGLPDTLLTSLQDARTVDHTSCSVTSSDFLSDGSPTSSQAFSEPSSPTTSSVTRCPRCSKAYYGAPSNQRRNLRRHMLEKHSIEPRLQCSVPGCSTTFPIGRLDNRNRHLEQQHGWENLTTLTPAHKRRRAT